VELSGWDAAAVCAKAITYAATLCAAGGVFFLAYHIGLLQDPQRMRIRRLVAVLLIISIGASAARIPLLAGSMSGSLAGMFDGEFLGMILAAGEGRATAIRIVGLTLAASVVSTKHYWRPLGIVGAIVASMSFGCVGHIHALLPRSVPTMLVGLHLLCAAFWLGALAPLLVVARDGNGAQIAVIAVRFGKSALGVVAVQLVAGATLLWILIGDAAEFWSSGYGRMMAIKLLTVAFLLSVAALNKLVLTPRLSRGDLQAARIFRRSIKAEMILGALILLITAAFTTVTGPP
jgi:copper resistance protein D